MNAQTLLVVGVAGGALLAALGAFAIAWRRSTSATSWRSAVSRETLKADSRQELEIPGLPLSDLAADSQDLTVVTEHEVVATSVAVTREQRVIEVSPEEAGVSRRQFFNRAIGATFGSFVAILGIQLLAFMWPKLKGGFGASVDAGTVADLLTATRTADGGMLPAFIPEARAYVVPVNEANLSAQFQGKNVSGGGLMALYQRCVHLGCRVPWCATSQGFECPCHGSKYDGIGEYFAGPAPRNLDRFVVEVIDDRFIIHTGDVIQTPRAPTRSVAYPQGPSCIGAVVVAE